MHKQSRDYTEDLNEQLSIKTQRANIHRAALRSLVHHWSGTARRARVWGGKLGVHTRWGKCPNLKNEIKREGEPRKVATAPPL